MESNGGGFLLVRNKNAVEAQINSNMNDQSVNAIDILNGVDAFYQSAWDKLLIVGTVSFAVIGILVPFMIQWYQRKTMKISEELLKKELAQQTTNSKEEILKELTAILDERIKTFETKMERLNASAEAKVFHVQGTGHLKEGLWGHAIVDYVSAGHSYLACDDFFNLRRIINTINDSCIDKVSLDDLNDLKTSSNLDLAYFLDEIEKFDEKYVFTDAVRGIRLKISKKSKIPS